LKKNFLATTFFTGSSFIFWVISSLPTWGSSLGGSLSTGWSLAEKYFDIPSEIRALDEQFDFNAILADPEGSWDNILQKGADYAITNGPTELQTIDQIVGIQDILANPSDGLDIAFDNAVAYFVNVLAGQIGNDCPEILRFVPGECPSGDILTGDGEGATDEGENSQDETTIPALDMAELPKGSAGLRQISPPNADLFSSNPTVAQRDLANLYDQEYARAQAARFLGKPGQTWLDTNAAATTTLVKQNTVLATEIGALAKGALSLDVTQDVMKNSAQIQSRMANIILNQSQIDAQQQASLLSVQQQQAALMQLSANLGEAIDESNRRERLERDVLHLEAGRAPIYLPGFEW
jgi:hypothetical protein